MALYAGREPSTRKHIISQTEGLALAFDSDEVLDFLQRAAIDPDPPVRHQALFSLSGFLPGLVRRRYRLSAQVPGIWSAFTDPDDPSRLTRESLAEVANSVTSREPDSGARRAAFLFEARSLGQGLIDLAGRSAARRRQLALLAAAQYPLASVRSALRRVSTESAGRFGSTLPFALLSGSNDEDLLKIIHHDAIHEPDLFLLLPAISKERAFRTILDMAPRTNTLGRCNLALSLGRLKDVDHEDAVARLMKFMESWVAVYCVWALEASGDPMCLDRVRKVYERSPIEFLRVQAIRAAGGIPGDDAREFCLQAMQDPSEVIRAQSLESLVRLRLDPDHLRSLASPLLNTPSLRLRVHAILATTSAREPEVPLQLEDLLFSDRSMNRIEAAYCLGYIQNARSLESLANLATLDPEPHVKHQAIKSLSRFPARDSMPRLVPILVSGEKSDALAAARVIGRYSGVDAREACSSLLEVLERIKSRSRRALVYRTLGHVGADTGGTEVPRVLGESLEESDPRLVMGGVHGWIAFGGDPLEEVRPGLRRIASRSDDRIVPRALMALVLGGDLERLDDLAAVMDKDDGEPSRSAVQTSLELGILVAGLSGGRRYPGLTRALDATRGRAPFEEFDRSAGVVLRDRDGFGPSPPDPEDQFEEGQSLLARALEPTPPEPAGRGGAKVAFSRLSTPIGLGGSGDEGLAGRLALHLRKPQVQREAGTPKFQQQLLEHTYLVAGPASASSGTTRPRGAGPRAALLGGATILGLLIVSLLLRSAIDTTGGPAPVSVSEVWGPVRLEGAGRPLRRGDTVEAGRTVRTGKNEKVRFVTIGGGIVSMDKDTVLTFSAFDVRTAKTTMTFETGTCGFDFGPGSHLEVRHDRYLILAHDAQFTIEADTKSAKHTLMVHRGSLRLEETGGRTLEMKESDSRPLD